jgi:teichuronic acid biosynthesis glycosyltransferase TuaC
MGKDLLEDRFGRFYEIPRILALCGNEVQGVCLKYWSTGNDQPSAKRCIENVEWRSLWLGRNWLAGLTRYYLQIGKIAVEFKPEVIVGVSDSIQVIMASSLSSRLRIPLVVDLYDNFESYRATQIPGIKWGLKRGIRQAVGISVVSNVLGAKVGNEYKASAIVRTVTNGICPEIFHPTVKVTARKRLGLPENGLLLGTAGSLTCDRGILALYTGFENLSRAIDNLFLVLAGPRDRRSAIPAHRRILYLGELPHDQVGDLFNSLDVGVIYNQNDAFGAYCFPQKMYEMLACKLPIVAADVGVVPKILTGSERFLYDSNRPETLIQAVRAQLNARYLPPVAIPTWRDQGVLFNELLAHTVSSFRRMHVA